jgi:predicted Zn-dependent protease
MAYNSHRNAKDLAPQVDFVRRSNSLINLQIAIALSNKADVTAAEQEQVLQLINQAITEAKAATVLEPENYQNWISLAQIYIQLLGTTEQAAQEAFNALAKAATYNPNDPEIRIGLGELFLKTERAADAVVFFTQAVERKPDLFIAHYYLAKAQVANNQLQEAKTSYANSLNLLEKDSEDYKTVEGELNALNKALEDQAAEAAKSKSDTASGSASLSPTTQSDNSALSGLLTEQDAESAIQEGALSSDQNLVEN